MAQFTDEQRAAIETHDRNLIVMAGAGSGKTRVLVERYLALLEKHPDWSLNALVAITFTHAAALEMRDRVRRELERRSYEDDDPAMRLRWSERLAQMDSARISTIHGLCADILRANAAEAGIDPQFTVLEPFDGDAMLSDVIDRELQVLKDEAEDDIASLFTEYDMRAIRSALSDEDVLRAPLDELPDSADALWQSWQDEWAEDTREAQQRLRANQNLQAAVDFVAPSDVPSGDKLTPAWQTVHQQMDVVFEADTDAALASAKRIVGAIHLQGGSKANWGSKEAVADAKAALRTIRELLKAFIGEVGDPPGEMDRRAAVLLLRWYGLVQRVRDSYARAKADESALDFHDLEARTADLLRNNEAVRVRYRNAEFRQVMVDEFQDTNAAQWQIVRSLVDLDNDASLFVVGDRKQSIYGFRGADVSVFGEVHDEIATRENGLQLALSRSFRSHPALVEALNELFDLILQPDDSSPVREYEVALDQRMDAFRDARPDATDATMVEIEVLLQHNPQGESVTQEERRLFEAHQIARRMETFHDDEMPVHDPHKGVYRAFEWGDGAILFRSMSNITLYEEILKALNIPFVTVAGRGFYNRQEVWDMLNLLRALHNPADDLSLASALRSPMFAFSDDMLYAYRLLRDEDDELIPLWDALANDPPVALPDEALQKVRYARETVGSLRELAGRVTIYELLRQSLAQTGYLAILSGLPGGARLRQNVEKLVEIAEQSKRVSLGAFAYYLEDLTVREAREGEAALDTQGALRLMTVHASKGLEFPVVVLADTSARPRSSSGAVLIYDQKRRRLVCRAYDDTEAKAVESSPYARAVNLRKLRERAEEKRLLYVAATRARDTLVISGQVRENKKDWKFEGWLKEVASVLGVKQHLNGTNLDTAYAFTSHARVRVMMPTFDPQLPRQLLDQQVFPEWQPVEPTEPVPIPLRLGVVQAPEERKLGHLNATQLADIGRYRHVNDETERNFSRQNVRRQVLDDFPAQIREAIRVRRPRVRNRQIGEVVHEALRYWRFPDDETDTALDDLLRSYAWQQQITDPIDLRMVVRRARDILRQFQLSDLYREVQAVRESGYPFYSEMPFIYRTEKRIIHGVIDALYQTPNGDWVILDYKTSFVPSPEKVEDHARQFYLQVGAYAVAVRQELGGQTPRVLLHYIQHVRTIEVPAATWEAEIEALEAIIGEMLGE